MIERTLLLRDGRQLTFAEIGAGQTWIHCHGIPGSRHELSHLDDQLNDQGLRIIIPDRPGYGGSSGCQDYSFQRHSEDVAELADHLRLPYFSLSGFSGGGVFALTTAAVLSTRVTEIRLAATPAVPLMPSDCMHAAEMTTNAWRSAMENRTRLASELTPLCEDAEGLSAALRQSSGEPDATYLATPAVRPYFEQSTVTALSQGASTAAAALARDTALMVHDWGNRVAALEQPIQLFHGTEDQLVHPPHQKALANYLPNAKIHIVPETGHYGLLTEIWR